MRVEAAALEPGGGVVASEFRPAWWLASAHLQTLWPTLFRVGPRVSLARERFELDDGDFLDLDWTSGADSPIVVAVHGLEGSSRSPYARGLLERVIECGWRGVVMHFRGCGGSMNRLDRTYHSGETGDLNALVDALRRREPDTPLAVVGYSLGGNVVLKWLGERGEDAPVEAAVAVSVPFVLSQAAERLDRGFSRLYQRWLLRSLQDKIRRKFEHHPDPPVDLSRLHRRQSMRAFDDAITAPLHGFHDARDYYARASSRPFLTRIARPTLILHARDDPFMTCDVVPRPHELGPLTRLELSEGGGHVGFVGGRWPGRARYWLEHRIPDFLAAYLGKGHPRSDTEHLN